LIQEDGPGISVRFPVPVTRTGSFLPWQKRRALTHVARAKIIMSDPVDAPEALAGHIRNALLKGFAIPAVLLVFFLSAGAWLNHNLHADLAKIISSRGNLTEARRTELIKGYARIDFADLCGGKVTGLDRLRTNLEEGGVCRQFLWLRWGAGLSALLIGLLVVVAGAIHALNRRAQRSAADLIVCYRWAWRLSIAAALIQLLLLIPLLGYGSFELMVLATDHYLVKVIVIIILAGLVGLWKGGSILLRRVPLEFTVAMARPVTVAEAPELWAEVQAAAARLGTAPPDHILLGMEHNFYVTELAVNHRDGRASGRTLYLSHPLLQQLAPDEVLAIIGHELGHFRGEDTRLTREFYPMKLKAGATLHAMAEAVGVGWMSVNTLLYFQGSFGRTEQTMSRARELVADRVAAELTSAEVAARALLKIHVFSEAFGRKLESGTANPFATPLAAYVRSNLAEEREFWDRLFEQKAAHPLDSHPTLRVRLEALNHPAQPEAARATFAADTATAYAHWFAGREALFAGITGEALEVVSRMRTTTADYATEEGRQLLDRHYPEVRWSARAGGLWFKLVLCGLGIVTALVLLFLVPGWEYKAGMAVLALLCAAPIVPQWKRHREGEFVLKADSLSYTGWHRTLLFADLASFNVLNNSGSLTFMLHLKEKAPGIWKYSGLNWYRRRVISLPLGLITGKPQEIGLTLHQYLTRHALAMAAAENASQPGSTPPQSPGA